MGGIFGGGGSGVSYIPAPVQAQARQPEAIQADKAVENAGNQQHKRLAANANKNIQTSPQGVLGDSEVDNKSLLGR